MGWGADYALWYYFGEYIPPYEFSTPYFQLGFHQGYIGWLFTACGGMIFITQLLRYLTTSIYITSKRVISKAGWLNVKVDGTDISDVRGVHVDQGWVGRFLDYGKIHLDCRFVEDVYLPFARAPYRLMKDIQHIKSQLEENTGRPPELQGYAQTIVQIHPGYHKGAHEVIEHPDEQTIVIKTMQDSPKTDAIEHRMHDELLQDFEKKA